MMAGQGNAMTYFDYKVVPAPRRMKKIRGVKEPEELFAMTLTEAINEHARQGWEYVRAESLTAETPGGWLRRGREETQTLLVFRRARETLGPRLAAEGEAPAPAAAAPVLPRFDPAPEPRSDTPPAPTNPKAVSDRPSADRVQGPGRREPGIEVPAEDSSEPTPLHPGPRLGPADRD